MKPLVYIWLTVLFVDNVLPLVLARFYPNYRHKEMALSVLGSRQSPVKWIYNVWCILSGTVFCIAPLALYQVNRSGLTVAIWILLAVYGIGLFFCFFIMGEKERFANTVLRYGGLWQRLVLVCCYVPILVLCLNLTATIGG